MVDKHELLRGFGVDEKTGQAALEQSRSHGRDRGICVCGHASAAHTEKVPEGVHEKHDLARRLRRNICKPGKGICPCDSYLKVLETSDARKFRFSTTGPAERHALSKGIFAALEADVHVEWAKGVICVKCKDGLDTSNVVLIPVAYERNWYEATRPTDENVLICKNCRETVELEWTDNAEMMRPDKSNPILGV